MSRLNAALKVLLEFSEKDIYAVLTLKRKIYLAFSF